MMEFLAAEGIAISDKQNMTMCPRCYLKYLKKRPRLNDCDKNVGEEESTDNTHADLDIDDSEPADSKTQTSFSYPCVDDLYYAPSSHRKCSICCRYMEDTYTLLTRARHQVFKGFKSLF